jgi:hypothetical protein
LKSVLYCSSNFDEFNEAQAISSLLPIGRTQIAFKMLPPRNGHTFRYRWDPMDAEGYCIIHGLKVLGESGVVEWEWSGCQEDVVMNGFMTTEGTSRYGKNFFRTSRDAQMLLNWSDQVNQRGVTLLCDIERLSGEDVCGELEIVSNTLRKQYDELSKKVRELQVEHEELECLLINRERMHSQCMVELLELRGQKPEDLTGQSDKIAQLEHRQVAAEESLKVYRDALIMVKERHDQLQNRIDKLVSTLQNIHSSFGWRIYHKLTSIIRRPK